MRLTGDGLERGMKRIPAMRCGAVLLRLMKRADTAGMHGEGSPRSRHRGSGYADGPVPWQGCGSIRVRNRASPHRFPRAGRLTVRRGLYSGVTA